MLLIAQTKQLYSCAIYCTGTAVNNTKLTFNFCANHMVLRRLHKVPCSREEILHTRIIDVLHIVVMATEVGGNFVFE